MDNYVLFFTDNVCEDKYIKYPDKMYKMGDIKNTDFCNNLFMALSLDE